MSNKRKSIFDSVKRFSSVTPNDNENAETSIDDEILQLESIDQEISKTLSLIHYNIDACNNIISTKFVPLLLNYKNNSREINNSTRFLKNLFENSLNVNIQVQKSKSGSSAKNSNKNSDNKNKTKETKGKEKQAPEKQDNSSAVTVEDLAKKVNINNSESLLSESILSNDSNDQLKIDINQLLQNFKAAREKAIRESAESNQNQNQIKIQKQQQNQNESPVQNNENENKPQPGNTPTTKREIYDVFANRSKIGPSENSSTLDFINNNSIIEQNTLTLENDANEKKRLRPSTSPSSSSKPPTIQSTSPFKIQISPIKHSKPALSSPEFRTPKRIKHRKSSAIIEQLHLDDSPDDIPKTPELTYLKFSPIKLKKSKEDKPRQNVTPAMTKRYDFNTGNDNQRYHNNNDTDTSRVRDAHQMSLGSLSSTTLDIPQLPSSLNFDDSNNNANNTTTNTNSAYQTPNQLFFNSTSSSAAFNLKLPPISLKFALPKLNTHLTRSPVKELARRYTLDYLDMEMDDDSSISSFELRNKKYNSSANSSTIDNNRNISKLPTAAGIVHKVEEDEEDEDNERVYESKKGDIFDNEAE